MQDGFVQINDAPGLGIEIRKDTLAHYRIN
jgi:L-alanine-DL-glutamate epimerase-like enolase superfamily enzyme